MSSANCRKILTDYGFKGGDVDEIINDLSNVESVNKYAKEIKGRIKLDDESLPFKDKNYEYWTKTTAKGNYSIKLRKKIGSNHVEEIWNGDKEKEKLNTEYFGLGDLEISYNDKYLGYSLDLKGSEYYTIYIRDISSNKLVTEKIDETGGGILLITEGVFGMSGDQGKIKEIGEKITRKSLHSDLLFPSRIEGPNLRKAISSKTLIRIYV